MQLSHSVLYIKATPCDFRFPWCNQYAADKMIDLMLAKQAIGLAAPQIGLSVRLFVMQTAGISRQCFNPEILAYSQNVAEFTEGCLSFPGSQCTLQRSREIYVRYHDAKGAETKVHLNGLSAICFQHELDHLDGITMFQRQKEQHAEQS